MDSSTFLLELYNKLKSGPQTIDSIYNWTKQKNFDISKRSIYRYLDKIESAALEVGYDLTITIEEFNKKKWHITSKNKSKNELDVSIQINELSNLLIAHKTLPLWFNGKTSILDSFQAEINKYPKIAFKYSSFLSIENSFKNSHFGELIFNNKLNNLLLDIFWCLENDHCFIIQEFDSLTNHSNQAIPAINELIKPIETNFHRGNYIIKCIQISNNQIYLLELDNIISLKISEERIKSSKFNKLLKSSYIVNFGYHPAYLNKTYKIKLQFPPTPGVHIMARHWHPNQKFEVHNNGNIIMTFESDLNIELVGWVMMWMENIKVIQPQQLKDIIKTKASKIVELYTKNLPAHNNADSSKL